MNPLRGLLALEEREQMQTTPAHLRRMAATAREQARLHEDDAATCRNRADAYEDLAAERERS